MKTFCKLLALITLCTIMVLTLTSCDTLRYRTEITITYRGYGDVVMVLDYENAPISSVNFKKLVESDFYTGVKMHRIAALGSNGAGWVVQGGDASQFGKTADSIKGEFSENGVENNLKHVRGTVAVARATGYDTGSSQFYICTETIPHLDGNYAAFGTVTSGMEAVDRMVADYKANNTTAPVIEKAVVTFDAPVAFSSTAAPLFGCLATLLALVYLYLGYAYATPYTMPYREKGKRAVQPDPRAPLCRDLFMIFTGVFTAAAWVTVYVLRWYTIAITGAAIAAAVASFVLVFVFGKKRKAKAK